MVTRSMGWLSAAAIIILVGGIVGSAFADIIIDPEVDIITNGPLLPPSGNLNAGTNNPLNYSAFVSGFTLNPAGGILRLINDTGAALSLVSFTFAGSANSADANGALSCGVTNTSLAFTCTASSSAGVSTLGSGSTLGTLNNPGQPFWTWTFNGSVAAGGSFDLAFGAFNAGDVLKTDPTAAVPEPGMFGPMGIFGAGLTGLGAMVRTRRWFGRWKQRVERK